MKSEINGKVLSERIRDKMAKLDLNQAELARLAQITPAALSQILNEERSPSGPVLVKLARALKESVDYLLGRSEKTDIEDLLQNKEVGLLFRNFAGLSEQDRQVILRLIEGLKRKAGGGK